ncbi:hypothetical protein J437_LFUL013754 [Ladona fulva]|uniref:Craniofacial development protein 2 n=1 Tax=Ladona fulva TaxID=123851 RepID=A0A8K0P4J1_LADFU|nr:hypothetical protein J437_LFUL013754 [Ladona fulva]
MGLGKHKLSFIKCHAPTEGSDDQTKDKFYEELEMVLDTIPKDHCKLILGDLNAKIGKEQIFLGKHSLHYVSNNDGIRFINFCTSKGLFISSTDFERKNIQY